MSNFFIGDKDLARTLSRDELLSFTMGAMALATGGGGIRPVEEVIEKMVDDAMNQGKKFKLLDLHEIPDDVVVLSGVWTGGGVENEQKLRWMSLPGFSAGSGGVLRTGFDNLSFIHDQIKQKDKTFAPLNSWSELPGPDWGGAGLNRLRELIGDKSNADSRSAWVSR